ncbi:FecR domain-containing protein [Pseudomonas sp.]|uniref:FecR domain-containing protein n=1 Tax=Pseudomonas sp. TaxID=306 RepID=UPI0022B3EB11|nr:MULTISPECIES: FecR family protein [Pseudomonas]
MLFRGVHGVTAPISPRIAEQAVQWLVELQAGAGEEEHRAWQQWRAADPEHERAWQRIETINQRLQGLPSRAARQAVLSKPAYGRREALKLMGVFVLLGPAAWLLKERAEPWLADYHTRIGEQRTVTLTDGSRLDLNTDSAVNVNITATQRQLMLIRGEILLHAAHSALPFSVQSQAGMVSTTQGRFNLRKFDDGCRLSVFAGSVQVRCAERPDLSTTLTAGQQVRFSAHHLGKVVPLDSGLDAWRDGLLVAAHMPLGQFIQELSRYQPGWLKCDEHVEGLLVSGTYPLKDIEAILAMLEVTQPVRIQRRARYWISIQPRTA